jgi:hypothetical protein
VQSVLNWVSKYTKTPVSLPLFILNMSPTVGIASTFAYNHTEVHHARTDFGFTLWLWYEFVNLQTPPTRLARCAASRTATSSTTPPSR